MNPHRPRPVAWLLPAVALTSGIAGAAALWLALSLLLRDPSGWFAPLVALDLAFMLRLAAAPPGRARATLAAGGTVLGILLAWWLVAAASMGLLLGLHPWESATRLGPVLAVELVRHGHAGWELALAALSPALAWWLAR